MAAWDLGEPLTVASQRTFHAAFDASLAHAAAEEGASDLEKAVGEALTVENLRKFTKICEAQGEARLLETPRASSAPSLQVI